MATKHILISQDKLEGERRMSVTSLLKPILRNNKLQAHLLPTGNDNRRIITCSDSKTNSLQETSFNVNTEGFTAQYWEIWDRKNRVEFELFRMYFHLFYNGEEYILLHSDPNDDDKTHGNYKRSPHLHIKCTDDEVIPHSHLALNITDYDTIFDSCESLTRAFKEHIIMIKSQVLDQWDS